MVTPSGLEDGVSRSRGEGAGEMVVERGPGAAYHMFVVMEDLVEKLKLLRYEEELLRKNNLKPLSRWVPWSPAPRYRLGPGERPSSRLQGNAERGLASTCLHLPSQERAPHPRTPRTWRRRAVELTEFRLLVL